MRNGEILRVGNLSQGWARAVLDIPIDYQTSMDEYREMTEEITRSLRKDPELSKAMLEDPEIAGVQSLSGSHRVIRTMVKTKPNLQWMVERAFRAELMTQLAKRGESVWFRRRFCAAADQEEWPHSRHRLRESSPRPDQEIRSTVRETPQ